MTAGHTREQLVKAYTEYAGKLITADAKRRFVVWLKEHQPDIAQQVIDQARQKSGKGKKREPTLD